MGVRPIKVIGQKRHKRRIGGQVRYLSGGMAFALSSVVLVGAFTIGGEAIFYGTGAALLVVGLILGGMRHLPGQMGQIDRLTGLPEKEALISWLGRARIRGNPDVSVMALRIDMLDALEERLGIKARQDIQRQAAERLLEFTRQDDFLAVLDKGAFLVGMTRVRAPAGENLLEMSRRLQTVFDDPFEAGAMRSYCTLAVGIASNKDLGEPEPEKLVSAAVRTLDLASASGLGAVRVFSEAVVDAQGRERDIARELTHALETGEIFAWFQPQICLRSGKVSGFEALARWDRPGHGLVSPASFLSDIERIGLSQRLGEVMLKQSLAALNAWDAAGFSVPTVSVNFSGDDLRNPRLADYLRWELDRHGLAPERLVVEVLESVVAESKEDMVSRTLSEISKIGCGIDLDDFGTGSTSIINIQRFKVSRIKIDRCLVTHVDRDVAQQRMVAALLALTQQLEIEALGEGVESEAEVEKLREMGCDAVQGYVAARPMPLGDSLQWLETHQAAMFAPQVQQAG